MSAALSCEGLACARGGRLLFEGLSFRLDRAGAALVTGPNGVGKSSLLRLLAGLLAPRAGRIEASGGIALLAEAGALDADRPLAAALGFWARLDDRPDPAGRVRAALGDLGIAHLADIPVRLLSTGQRRRAAFARVLASGAAVWLLDEPANGLDAAAATRLEAMIARHRAAGGIVVAATHQPLAMPGAIAVPLA